MLKNHYIISKININQGENMGSYFYEKSKMYYKKYKNGQLVCKISAVIKDGDKYLVLVKQGKRACLIGGSVEDGETT